MAQDDVTDPPPLRGGRQRANHIQVHRIELGLKEREYAESLVAGKMVQSIGQGAGMVATGAALGLAAWGLYWFFDSGWGIVQRIDDAWEAYKTEASEGNIFYLTPNDDWVDDQVPPEDNWMRGVADDTPLDTKWWKSLVGL